MMSNLVEHAKRELGIIGEEPEIVKMYLNIVEAFAAFGHSGGSASVAIPTINRLLQFQNLAPLTDDPDEWNHISEDVAGSPGGIWQSSRNAAAFSNDGGQSYYLVDQGMHNIHKSEHKEK